MTRHPSGSAGPAWRFTGADRPPFADAPAPGQESVWDYPRPPRLVPDGREVVVRGDELLRDVAWSYPAAAAPYEAIAGCFSVYPGLLECLVEDERVRPQDGGFYGGWVTSEIVGPWKGGPGTSGW